MKNNNQLQSQDKKIFGLKKNVFVLGITSFFNDISSEMIASSFPVFFLTVLKAGAASLGLVEGISEGFANFIKIFSGKYSDKIQKRKPFVIFGYALSTLTRPLYIIAHKVPFVLFLRLSDRIGKGLRDSPRDAIISLSAEREESGKAFNFHRSLDIIGSILGPILVYLIFLKWGQNFSIVFLTSFFFGLLALGSLYWVKDIKISFHKDQEKNNNNQKISLRLKNYIISVFFFSLGTLPISVLLLKLKELNIIIIPLFYSFISFFSFLAAVFATKFSDKIGHRKLIIIGFSILILSYFILSQSFSYFLFGISFFLYGIFIGLTDGTLRSYASKRADETIRGKAYGYLNGLSGLGLLLAGIIWGFCWQKFGPLYSLLGASFFVLIGLIIFLTTQFKKDKDQVYVHS